jgi:hypothetical protein
VPAPDISIVNRTPFELAHQITQNGNAVQIVLSLSRPERARLRPHLKPAGIEVDMCAHGIFLDRTCHRCAAEKDPTFRAMLRGEL